MGKWPLPNIISVTNGFQIHPGPGTVPRKGGEIVIKLSSSRVDNLMPSFGLPLAFCKPKRFPRSLLHLAKDSSSKSIWIKRSGMGDDEGKGFRGFLQMTSPLTRLN